ncbi:MAG TPA: Uma2 family endonuclease [Pyrinomonadaceae bacterium]|jgi:Uma2 family endonuclease|nr:Uma2 family endonuclease [Pyrinomonadaceae bacterium]
MASRIEPLLTVADLDACPDDNNRYELIGGELFVSRAPGISHQRVLLNLQVALSEYLRANPIGILVPGPGMILSDYDAVIPDICFVRNERWDEVVTGEKFTRAVDLVIEIISSGKENRERDLKFKRQLYAKYGVQEYWIVDRENRCTLIYRLQGDNLKEIARLGIDDEITTPLLPQFQLKVSSLFNF